MNTTLATIVQLGKDKVRDQNSLSIDWTAEGFRAINGMLQLWNQNHDWPWQSEYVIVNYNEGITFYPISSALNFKAIIDVRPQKPGGFAGGLAGRYHGFARKDTLYYCTNTYFEADNTQPKRFALMQRTQQQMLRIRYRGNQQIFCPASDISSNGTWVGAGAISNVRNDQYESYEQPSSVAFDYSGTTGTVTNSTVPVQDLSLYQARGVFYWNWYFQTITNWTSLTLKIGSDASNYYTTTVTADYLGNAPIVGGWSKFSMPWSGQTTQVGTPVVTKITYVQVTMTYSMSTVFSAGRFENFFVSNNVPMIFEYYSTNMTLLASDSITKNQIFQNSANTSDTALWSGTWDWVNESFANNLTESSSYLTGDITDEQDMLARTIRYLKPLKEKLPSKRRYPEVKLVVDLNLYDQ